jgi:hypothetical protein
MSQGQGITPSFSVAVAILIGSLLTPQTAECGSSAMSIAQEADAEFGYVGGATTRGGGANMGPVDELSTELRYVFSPQLSRRLFLRFGADWQRFSFGVPERALLPRELQQISAIIGFDWQVSDEWLFRAELQPGIFSDLQDVSWRDVDAPLLMGGVYVVNADLQWLFGLRVVPRSEYPVLPALGVRWKFAAEWTLNLFLPNPRLEYDLNDRLKAYVGASLKAGTFTVSDDFGNDNGRTDLNHAALDYFEVRTGPGISWKVRPNLTLDANAGCMVNRVLGYFDQDLVARSRPAPDVQIACHWQF